MYPGLKIIFVFSTCLTLMSEAGWAQGRQQRNQSQGGATVGELLQRVSREDRGRNVELSRDRRSLPQSQDTLRQRRQQTHINLDSVRPSRSSAILRDDRSDSDRAALERVTDQQIEELFRMTQRFRNSPNRGELWLRLAELYNEKAQIISFRKEDEYDRRLKEFQEGRSRTRPQLDLSEAREYNRKAIQLYEWFVRDFPNDPKMDQALFFLGFNHFDIGDTVRGRQYYQQLTRRFPQSPFVGEAHFALGEFHFENSNWSEAYTHYMQVIRNRNPRLQTFSIYKAAWCLFRMGRAQESLTYMERLIRQNQEEQRRGGRTAGNLRLEQEALRDVVVFYAEAGDPSGAVSYFRSLAGSDANDFLERLALVWSDKGRREAAVPLFKHLIAQNPRAPKAFEFQYQIVTNLSHANQSREFREELFRWIRDYSSSSAWGQANRGNAEIIENSVQLREATLRNHVLQAHQNAQNTRSEFAQNRAEEGYRLYLGEFDGHPEASDMRFFFGELLFDMGRYTDAANQYRWVVQNAPQSQYVEAAAINIVLALEKDLPSDEQMQQRTGQSLERVQLDPRVDRFVRAGKEYVEQNPRAEKAPNIRFRMGRLLYLSNHFDEAEKEFRYIVENHPRTEYAEYSANLLLDIYNLRQDFEGLERVGQELLAVPGLAGTQTGSDIREVMERASFKRAQELETNRQFAESARQFETFARQNPNSSLATTAFFNAGVNHERAGNTLAAIGAYNQVLRSRDNESAAFRLRSQRFVAKLYQDSGQYESAARSYQQAGAGAQDPSEAADFFYNAAILFAALGQAGPAIANYDEYLKRAPASEREEILYQKADLLRRHGSAAQAIQAYEIFINSRPTDVARLVEAHYRISRLNGQAARQGIAREWRDRTVAVQRERNPALAGAGAPYAAAMRLEQVLETLREFQAVRIGATTDQAQQQAAQRKTGLLEKLEGELTEVIRYDSPDQIVGALTILGHAYAEMAEALSKAPAPSNLNLNEEEMRQFRAAASEFAAPYRQTATDSYRRAVERAWELEVDNSYYREAKAALLLVEPDHHYDRGERPLRGHFIHWMGI